MVYVKTVKNRLPSNGSWPDRSPAYCIHCKNRGEAFEKAMIVARLGLCLTSFYGKSGNMTLRETTIDDGSNNNNPDQVICPGDSLIAASWILSSSQRKTRTRALPSAK